MKVRKYMIAAALAGVLCVTASCSFLKEEPTTSLSETSAYRSEEALESQVYGILSSFYGKYMMQGYMNEQLHTASGLMMWKGQRTQDDWTEGQDKGHVGIETRKVVVKNRTVETRLRLNIRLERLFHRT